MDTAVIDQHRAGIESEDEMSVQDYGYESYDQMLSHAEHNGGGVDMDADAVKWVVSELAALRQRIAELEAQAATLIDAAKWCIESWPNRDVEFFRPDHEDAMDSLMDAIAATAPDAPNGDVLRPRQCCAKCDARAEAVREAAAHAKTDQDTGSVAGWKDMSSQERRMWRMGYVCGTQDMHDSIRAMPIPPCDCNPLAPEA